MFTTSIIQLTLSLFKLKSGIFFKRSYCLIILFMCLALTSCETVEEDVDPNSNTEAPDDNAQTFNPNTYYNSTDELSLWVPPNQQTLRGIFFFHGADIRNEPGGNNKRFANQELVQRQLAEMWGFALLRGNVWSEERRGSGGTQKQVDFYLSALEEFAPRVGHPELANLPAVIMGGSRFGGFGQQLAKLHPGRVIGFVSFVAALSQNEESIKIPGVCMPGDQDSSSESQINLMNKIFAGRTENALWAIAMLWGVDHKCGYCMDYSYTFLDQVIKERLPDNIPSDGNITLKDYQESEGWLGQMEKYNTAKSERRSFWNNRIPTVADFASYAGDKSSATWIPNEYLAKVWQSFALYENTIKASITTPTQETSRNKGLEVPSEIKVGDAIDIKISISDNSLGDIYIYNGDKELGQATKDGSSATLSGISFSEPGLYSLYVVSGGNPISRPVGLIVMP